MTGAAWDAFNATEQDLTVYMECRALPRCGELPVFPTDIDRVIKFRDLVTVSYRDWQRMQVWVTLAELWLECAE